MERMFKGTDRRTELELCMIKLCTPELDDTMESVVRRLSVLERAVRNGLTSHTIPPSASVNQEGAGPSMKEEPLLEKKEQAVIEKNEPVSSEGKEEMAPTFHTVSPTTVSSISMLSLIHI